MVECKHTSRNHRYKPGSNWRSHLLTAFLLTETCPMRVVRSLSRFSIASRVMTHRRIAQCYFNHGPLPYFIPQNQRTVSKAMIPSTLPRLLCSTSADTLHSAPGNNITNGQSGIELEQLCQLVFSLELPEGHCVGLRLNDSLLSGKDALSPEMIASGEHWIRRFLHAQEVAYGLAQPYESPRQNFFLGRLAIREAFRRKGVVIHDPILKDDYKRPKVQQGYLGSVSHKGTTGVAIVAPDVSGASPGSPKKGIGIDIERTYTRTGRMNGASIAKRVLTEQEFGELGRIEGLTIDEEALLRFSLKESVYKAMHPLICQYVGFREAEVTPHANGTASVVLNLKSGAQERFGPITAHWRRLDCDEFFLTSASVVINDNARL